jgi:WD40 repeat protein
MFTSPDGRFLVANTSPGTVWNLENGELHALVPPEHAYAGVSMGVGRMRIECVSNDWLGIRTFDYVKLEPGEELRDWPVPGTIKTHHFSPDGSLVALLNWSDVVTVCDVNTRKALHTIESAKRSLQHCRFAPDGKTLVLYASDHIAIWDMASAAYRVEKIECDRPYWMLAFHPTVPVVALRRRDGLLSLVSLETGEELRTLDFDAGKPPPQQSLRFSPVICAAFSPDGLTCAVGGSNKQFAVFDLDV